VQLLGLSKCTSIDYLRIISCTDCTQVAWCGLQLQSITGKDPFFGNSLNLFKTPGISDICGFKNLKGALTGAFNVNAMNGLVSLYGAEGITSVGVFSDGNSIHLESNPILASAIALANTEYPAGTFYITDNPNLECVPSKWPATDKKGNTIPHGSCPPAPGSIGSTGGDMLIVIAVLAALACAAGFVYYRRRASAAHKKGDPLQKSLLGADELEMWARSARQWMEWLRMMRFSALALLEHRRRRTRVSRGGLGVLIARTVIRSTTVTCRSTSTTSSSTMRVSLVTAAAASCTGRLFTARSARSRCSL
jgi:hypothetical protein